MSVHQQFDEDLTLFALGELEGEKRLALETHLEECPDCRRELEQLGGDLALLALSALGPEPPSRCRDRLMAAIAKEPRRTQHTELERKNWRGPLEWAIGVAAVIVILLLWHETANLQRRIAGLEANSASQLQQLAQAKELMDSLTSPEAEHFTFAATNTPPLPQGKVIYLLRSATVVFLANNMPQLPPQKTYELWLIPASGAPIPAGLFKPRPDGSATVIKPPLPSGLEAKTFAITVEPEAGSPAPTSQPIMVAARG
jgi:anti-sigma-K factor RskA